MDYSKHNRPYPNDFCGHHRPSSPNKSKPLQFKRATAKAFRVANIVLLEGQPAVEIDTYKMKIGDGHTRYNSLPYIGYHNDGKDGKSAYQIWRDAGYDGTIDDFLEFCVGPAGKSSYEIWLSLGNEGTIVDFINNVVTGKPGKDGAPGKDGIDGDSAYDIWVKEGNEGTISDFLNSLNGKSAYDIWIALGNKGTEKDFIESLKGDSAYDIWISQGNVGSEADFIEYLKGKSAYQVWIDEGNVGTTQEFLDSLKGESAFEIWKVAKDLPEATEQDFISDMQTTSWGSF